jgi:hypothetical protein
LLTFISTNDNFLFFYTGETEVSISFVAMAFLHKDRHDGITKSTGETTIGYVREKYSLSQNTKAIIAGRITPIKCSFMMQSV